MLNMGTVSTLIKESFAKKVISKYPTKYTIWKSKSILIDAQGDVIPLR